MSAPAAPNIGFAKRLRRSLRRDPGLFFMPALLIVSLAITVAIHPQFSDFDLQSLAMGALPLALGSGTGSELRRPLGITIIGGLIVSQMLTLFTTPVVYIYMDRFGTWRQRSHKRHLLIAPQEGD